MPPGEMDLDPDETASQAAQVANNAETHRLALEGIVAEIQDMHAMDPKPWGNDEAGSEFADGPDRYLALVDEVLENVTVHSQTVEDLAVTAGENALLSDMQDEIARDQMQQAAQWAEAQLDEFNQLFDDAPDELATAAILADPASAGAVADLHQLASDPQARQELGETAEQADDLVERLTEPNQ